MDLGLVQPNDWGVWSWPYRQMEDGDWFRVDPAMRSLADVRTMTYARSTQLNRARQYTVSRDADGYTVVRRNVARGGLPRRPELLPYGDARAVLTRYGVNLDELPIHYLKPGQSYRFDGPRSAPVPDHPWFVAQLPDCRIAVTQDDHGFTIERAGDRDTFQSLSERKMLLD